MRRFFVRLLFAVLCATPAIATQVVYVAEQDIPYVTEIYVVDIEHPGISLKLNKPISAQGYGVGDFELSPDGQLVAYTADQDTSGNPDLYLVSLDRPSVTRRLGSLDQTRIAHIVRFSPDGKKIAFTAFDQNYGDEQLYVVDLATPDIATHIGGRSGTVSSNGFAFTPDSRSLVYAADQDRPGAKELYLVEISRPNEPQKLNPSFGEFGSVGDSFEARFALTADGTRVIYSATQDTRGLRELYMVELATPGVAIKLNPPLPPQADIDDFSISPDGRHVAYTADQEIDYRFETYLVDLAQPGIATKVNGPVQDGAVLSQFTADNRTVLYLADEERPRLRDLYGFLVNDGSTVRLNQTLTGDSWVSRFVPSHDGTRVVYSAHPPGDQFLDDLFMVDLHSPQNAVRLNEQPSRIHMDSGRGIPAFSPDDQWVAYVGVESGSDYRLYGVDLRNPGTSVELNGPIAPEGQVSPASYRNRFAFVPEPANPPYQGLFAHESPSPGSIQGGVGLIRGWACYADEVAISIDDGSPIQIAFGTSREDTRGVCGDADNGYGMVIAWGLLGNGPHRLTTFIDGLQADSVEFEVIAIGDGFVRGLAGEYVIENFPAANERVRITWSEPDQNFIVTGVDTGGGLGTVGEKFSDTSSSGTYPDAEQKVGGAHHESPAQHSIQSGVGLIRGWACDADKVEVSIDGGERIRIAYGTSRADT